MARALTVRFVCQMSSSNCSRSPIVASLPHIIPRCGHSVRWSVTDPRTRFGPLDFTQAQKDPLFLLQMLTLHTIARCRQRCESICVCTPHIPFRKYLQTRQQLFGCVSLPGDRFNASLEVTPAAVWVINGRTFPAMSTHFFRGSRLAPAGREICRRSSV